MSFSDKVVLITGASSGIGAGTAEYFAELGANLALTGRNKDNLSKTLNNCKKINPKIKAITIEADVTKDAHLIIDQTVSNFSKIDVLVNNAGIVAFGSVLDADVEQFDSIMNTNLRAVYELTKLAAPYLIKTQGSIVNVSSVAALRSFPGAVNYCMSKAALDQFTKCTALDLAPHKVRVNAVNPGLIITDIHRRGGGMDEATYQAYLERSKTTHAIGRVGVPSEVASVIAFLASSDASFITGTCISVDGGKHVMCPR